MRIVNKINRNFVSSPEETPWLELFCTSFVVWGDGIKCSMKGVDSIPFDDTKAVIHKACG